MCKNILRFNWYRSSTTSCKMDMYPTPLHLPSKKHTLQMFQPNFTADARLQGHHFVCGIWVPQTYEFWNLLIWKPQAKGDLVCFSRPKALLIKREPGEAWSITLKHPKILRQQWHLWVFSLALSGGIQNSYESLIPEHWTWVSHHL